MFNIQKNIGQDIVSLQSRDIIGCFKSFSVKNNRLDLIYCFNDFDDTELSFPAKNVLSFGDDFVILKNENALTVCEENYSDCIFGLPVINQQGKRLGYLLDVELEENLKIQNLVLGDKKIASSEIDVINNKFILLKGKYKVKNRNIVNKSFDYLVKIQSEIPNTDNLPKINEDSSILQKPAMPEKRVAISPALLGKTITKDIYYNDKIIIKMGTVITQKVIELASLSGNIPAIISNSI